MNDQYTAAELNAGLGRCLNAPGTCIIQRGSEDVFETHPQESGWKLSPGWHIAGSASKGDQRVTWCDMW